MFSKCILLDNSVIHILQDSKMDEMHFMLILDGGGIPKNDDNCIICTLCICVELLC